MKLVKASLKRTKTQIILANGSERGDYIPMQHIFSKLGRIHDGFQLMKTYYPNDEMWSSKGRISGFTKKKNVNYAWDYEYDDYHPFDLFEESSKTCTEISEIKHYGSDLHLTLTLDISLPDETLIKIVKSLTPYGRIYLRINHESNGEWFRHNIQNTYQEVSKFFVRFHKIIKTYSSNIYTIFSLSSDSFVSRGIVGNDLLHLSDRDLLEALSIADYWSIDKYVSLHFGWPFSDKATEKTSFKNTIEDWWKLVEETYLKMIWHNGLIAKKLFINEFNSDSDVDGYYGQAAIISSVYKRLSSGEFEWLQGIVLYQFRDYGGLGLEKGNLSNFEQLPSLKAYKDEIGKFKYQIVTEEEWNREDYCFYWADSDSIRGLQISDIGNYGKFVNHFNFPVFILLGEQQEWIRLEPEDSYNLEGIDKILLLVPPHENVKKQLLTQTMVRNISDNIHHCFY